MGRMAGGVTAGVFGKLPARGDFVTIGLPRDFVGPWDEWLSAVVAGSRSLMGEKWLPAWLEAPVWRFRFPPGLCGHAAVLGLLMPSLDRVGRYFPLTIAAVLPGRAAPPQAEADRWLDCCEAAGRAALERDAAPDEVLALLAPLPTTDDPAAGGPLWWTAGGPLVGPRQMRRGLPDRAGFAAMLADAAEAEP